MGKDRHTEQINFRCTKTQKDIIEKVANEMLPFVSPSGLARMGAQFLALDILLGRVDNDYLISRIFETNVPEIEKMVFDFLFDRKEAAPPEGEA